MLAEAMVAYTKPQQRKKEESERLRGEQIGPNSFVLDLKEGKLSDSEKGEEENKMSHKLHVFGMDDDWWDRVRGLGTAAVYPENRFPWPRLLFSVFI